MFKLQRVTDFVYSFNYLLFLSTFILLIKSNIEFDAATHVDKIFFRYFD